MTEIKNTLKENIRVKILNKKREIIDEALVIFSEGNEIKTKSEKLYPGKESQFVLLDNIWVLLFRDPFTGERCYGQNSPDYFFEKMK